MEREEVQELGTIFPPPSRLKIGAPEPKVRAERPKEEAVGLLGKMKDAMGQAQEWQGQQAAAGAAGGMDMGAAVADRDSLQGQAREQNRILSVGGVGMVLIKSHVDTGENVAGNPVWIFDLEVTPEGGSAYAVQHREIVSSMSMGYYGDGTSMACRIDPADPQKIAFGEKPFM
jgi:hypothetical protein